jgi:hypothetical protein
MVNDSATGGYLAPDGTPAPAEDSQLDAVFQQLVVGIVGIEGLLVRPRWQPTAPKQPEASVTWCAIGMTGSFVAPIGAAIEHVSTGAGSDHLTQHESIDLATTFYGPLARAAVARLRDGLAIPQNIEAIAGKDFAFVACGTIRTVPEIVNQQWIRRYDMQIAFRRKVSRVYAVRNVLSADIHLFDDTHVDETIHVPP